MYFIYNQIVMIFDTSKNRLNRILVILLCCVLFSCKTSKNVVYLQDALNKTTDTIEFNQGIVIQPKDILSIVVSCRDPELSISLNLPLYSYQAGSTTASSSYSSRMLGYLVDMEGCIDFPLLGRLKVAGLTREQLTEMIKQKIVENGLIREPIVNTEIMNFRISVLGEVRSPGFFSLQDDKITILEAIARAGDLTIYGRRDNVLVQRHEQNGVINNYYIDLRSVEMYHSPAFYLKQNDVVYVSPNNTIAARSRINENRTLGVSISLASFLTNLALLVINLTNK